VVGPHDADTNPTPILWRFVTPESVIGTRHHRSMAAPDTPIPRPRLELSLVEAQTRFRHIVRLAGGTGQITTIVDAGRPAAAIVPVDIVQSHQGGERTVSQSTAVGWQRRIEQVATRLRQQHAHEARNLRLALDQVWRELDQLRPAGADPDIDALRASHTDIRRPR
jgi:antitoxin (DNA-binding transcriptional repressor) of toxin-antitoxin stability system